MLDHVNLSVYINALTGQAQNAITSIAVDEQPDLPLTVAPNNVITLPPVISGINTLRQMVTVCVKN